MEMEERKVLEPGSQSIAAKAWRRAAEEARAG